MDEAKQKLARLEEFMPSAGNDLVCKFGRFLSEYLNPELIPMGFVMGCELAIHDLQKGVNGFTQKPISGGLVGYPPIVYALLRTEIPHIAEAVCPPDFAAEVKAFIEEIRAGVQKEQVTKQA